MIKKIISIVLSVSILGGCTGMNENETISDAEIKEEMKAYARETFGGEFELFEFEHVNPSKGSPARAYLRSVDSESDYDRFLIKRTWNGKEAVFEDDYSNIYYRDMAYEELRPIIEKYFGESEFLILLGRGERSKTDYTHTNYSDALKEDNAGYPEIILLVNGLEYIDEKLVTAYNDCYKELFDKYEDLHLRLYTLEENDNVVRNEYDNLYSYIFNYYFDQVAIESNSEGSKRKSKSVFWLNGEVVSGE